MDRKIEKKTGFKALFQKKNIKYLFIAAFVIFIIWIVLRKEHNALRIDSRILTTGVVTQGEFNDYIRINGQVQPISTVQLSPMEGGMVESIIKEEGSTVKKVMLLSFSATLT